MPETRLSDQQLLQLRRSLSTAHAQGVGFAAGALCALGLFAATSVLVLRGGSTPGAHLGLLSVYFPGYSVTWSGAVIGAVYAFVYGYGMGRMTATLYNRFISK